MTHHGSLITRATSVIPGEAQGPTEHTSRRVNLNIYRTQIDIYNGVKMRQLLLQQTFISWKEHGNAFE
jgi:hypothetical protein